MSMDVYEVNFRRRCAEVEACKAEMTACRARLATVWRGLPLRHRMWFRWAFFAHRCDIAVWSLYVLGAKRLLGWREA